MRKNYFLGVAMLLCSMVNAQEVKQTNNLSSEKRTQINQQKTRLIEKQKAMHKKHKAIAPNQMLKDDFKPKALVEKENNNQLTTFQRFAKTQKQLDKATAALNTSEKKTAKLRAKAQKETLENHKPVKEIHYGLDRMNKVHKQFLSEKGYAYFNPQTLMNVNGAKTGEEKLVTIIESEMEADTKASWHEKYMLEAIAWNNSGYPTIVIESVNDAETGEWRPMYRIILTYNDMGLTMSEYYQHWYAEEDEWRDEYRVMNKVIEAGTGTEIGQEYLINTMAEAYVAILDMWIPEYRSYWHVDENNDPHGLQFDGFEMETQEWYPEWKERFMWFDSGALNRYEYAIWDAMDWQTEEYQVLNEAGLETEYCMVKHEKVMRTYTETGMLASYTEFMYHNILNDYVPTKRGSYNYNTFGDQILSVYEDYNPETEAWYNVQRYHDFYSAEGMWLGYDHEVWLMETEAWFKIYMELMNEEGHLIEELSLNGNDGYYWSGYHNIYEYTETSEFAERKSWNEDDQTFYLDSDVLYTYTEGNLVSELHNEYDEWNQGLHTNSYYYEYDMYGNNIVHYTMWYDEYYDEWNGDQSEFGYLDFGYETKEIYYWWDDNNEEWVISSGWYIEFPQGYAGNGVIAENYYLNWDSYLGEWVKGERYLDSEYSIDLDVWLKYERYYWQGDTIWIPEWKKASTLDANNNFTEILYQGHDGTNWVNNNRTISTYSGMYLLSNGHQYWDGTAWVDEWQWTLSYDANNNLEEELYQEFDGTTWTNVNRYVYAYDASNNLLSSTYQESNGTEWYGIWRDVNSYDASNNHIEMVYQENELSCPDGFYYDAILATCVEASQYRFMLEDWDNSELDWYNWNGLLYKEANPDSSSVNPSDSVGMYVADGVWGEGITIEMMESIDLLKNPIFSLQVKAPGYGQIQLRLENTDFSSTLDEYAVVNGTGGWEELVFDFSDYYQPELLNKLTIIFNSNNDFAASDSIYFDNFMRGSYEEMYIKFDDAIPAFITWSEIMVGTTENPETWGNNADMVGYTYKQGSGENWNGFILDNGNPPIDVFSHPMFSLNVLSQDNYYGGQVAIGIKEAGNVDTEYKVTNTYYGYGDWETLYFDFSGAPDTNDYNEIVIYLGYGNSYGEVWYFDELKGPHIVANAYAEADPFYEYKNISRETHLYNNLDWYSGNSWFTWDMDYWHQDGGWVDMYNYNTDTTVYEYLNLQFSDYNYHWEGMKEAYAYDEDGNLIEQLNYDYNYDSTFYFIDGWYFDEIFDAEGNLTEVIDKWFESSEYYDGGEWYYDGGMWYGQHTFYHNSNGYENQYRTDEYYGPDDRWITVMINYYDDTMEEELYLDFYRYDYNWPKNAYGDHMLTLYNTNGSVVSELYEEYYGPTEIWVGQNKTDYTYGINTCDVMASILVDGAETNEVCEGEVVLTVDGFEHFMWSTGEEVAELYVSEEGEYNVMAVTSEGCTGLASIDLMFLPVYNHQEICNVTVEDGQNVITWEEPVDEMIASYSVFKMNEASMFDLLGNVAVGTTSIVDADSDAAMKSESYAMNIVALNGCESQMSEVHTTIHLNSFLGHMGENNLVWGAYEGAAFTSYEIYRGTDATNLSLIATVSNMTMSYTDTEAPTGVVYYQVNATGFDCGEAKSNVKKAGYALVDITSIPVDTAVQGKSYLYYISADYEGTSPVMFSISGLPAGLEFTDLGDNTATIAGSPSEFGSFNIAIEAEGAYSNDVQEYTLIVEQGVSVHANAANVVDVYPNPANDYITIENASGAVVGLYNVTGSLILEQDVLSNNFRVDVDNLERGVYLMIISSNDQNISKRIVLE